ncbi:hypothetical protein GC174_14950 [bacterium]|nr:hypothetical protein [bacterium]
MQSAASFQEFVKSRKAAVEDALGFYLGNTDKDSGLLQEAMRYSVLSGGKRLRALLCIAAFETISGINHSQSKTNWPDYSSILPIACAIEMVHAMSLIHDDLPCLDDDDLRRGRPTNHKVFGEAMALLAGDALLMKAVELIIDRTPAAVDRSVLLEVVKGLSEATGARGMVGGQVFDLIYTGQFGLPENVDTAMVDKALKEGLTLAELSVDGSCSKEITAEKVEAIHRLKTGALIRYALTAGSAVAGASEFQLEGIHKFGEILGLAFQIADDLLDVTGDSDSLGKTPGKDEKCDKATWIKVFGVEGAREKLKSLDVAGRETLANYNLQSSDFPVLEQLLEFAIVRTN